MLLYSSSFEGRLPSNLEHRRKRKEIAAQYSLSRKIRTLVLLVHVAITRKIDVITINEVRINNDA